MTREKQHPRTPLTPAQRHQRGHDLAMANLYKNGTDALRDQLRGGFMARFEAQVDAAVPGLRDTDPLEYERRVAAALREQLVELSRRSLASRAAKRDAKHADKVASG